VTELQMDG